VDGGGHHGLGQAAADELQHGHLSGGVLHRHTVCAAAAAASAEGVATAHPLLHKTTTVRNRNAKYAGQLQAALS
jgi:hypothetical protein